MQKFYVDKDGNYLGSFNAGKNKKAKHPYGKGAIAVDKAPENGLQTYDVDAKKWNPLSQEIVFEGVREERSRLLKESDWTQLDDTPQAVKEAYAPYRQKLRDIPQDFDDADAVEWPRKPV